MNQTPAAKNEGDCTQQDHIPTFLHRGASGSVTQVVCIMGVLLMT